MTQAPEKQKHIMTGYKQIVLITTLLTISGLIYGCQASEATKTTTPFHTLNTYPLSIEDSTGEILSFEEAPKRIVSFSAADTEILFALGVGGRLVGRDKFSNYPSETTGVPIVGDAFTINLEQIAKSKPDLVLFDFVSPKKEVARLGYQVLVLTPPNDVKGILERIKTLGNLVNQKQSANDLVDSMQLRIDAVQQSLANVERGPRVFYELDPALWTAGPETFIGSVFSLMKIENIAEGAVEPYPQLSLETIIAKNPEIILLGDSLRYGTQPGETLESIKQRPGWNKISAVKNARIYPVDPALLSRAGPRIVLGIEQLANLIYPELYQ